MESVWMSRQWVGNVLKGAKLSLKSANSGNLIKHWTMNWAQFNDPLSHTCLADVVLASWSLTQEVAGLIPFKNKYILSLNTTCLFAQIFSCIFLFIISLLVIYFIDKFIEQECIPVGCVPSAWDALPGGEPVDPLECGPGDTPPATPLNFPPGCEPGDLQGMLGYHLQGMLGYHLQGMLGYHPSSLADRHV